MKASLLLLLYVLAFAGCGSNRQPAGPQDNARVIEIPTENTASILDVAGDYTVVGLDPGGNEDGLLGTVSKMRVFRDRIYVMDALFTDRMLIFDKEGAFLKKVSGKGRGPQEYVSIRDFEINYGAEEIWLLEDGQGKILIFDLDGNYKSTLENKIYGNGLAVLSNGNIVRSRQIGRTKAASDEPGEGYKLLVLDRDGNVVLKDFYSMTEYGFLWGSSNSLNPAFDGTVTFAPQFGNGIYRISEDGMEQVYYIDFRDMVDKEELAKFDVDAFNSNPISR